VLVDTGNSIVFSILF